MRGNGTTRRTHKTDKKKSGTIPDEWRVRIPIHKKEEKTNPNNFRNIMLLSSFQDILKSSLIGSWEHATNANIRRTATI